MNSDEYKDLIAAVYRIIGAEAKRFDDLRHADLEAIRLAHQDLTLRLEGFPQQFATKEEMKAVSEIVQKLDRDTISREVYDQNHQTLVDLVNKLERGALERSVFSTFVENYRIEQERASRERADVAGTVASASARSAGGVATWKLLAALVAIGATIVSVTVSLVVLFANNSIG